MSQGLISLRFPYLPLQINIHGAVANVEALIDTGFDGDAAVPETMIGTAISPDGHIPCVMADGSQVLAPYFRGNVRLRGLGSFQVVVLAMGDEPLVGRGVVDRFMVTFDHGRRVIVEP
jgi:predicted aspartyl protease